MVVVKTLKLNKKQALFNASTVKTRVWLGGRASGKSFGLGMSLLNKAILMPGSKGGLVAKTFHQILTKTMDSVKDAWRKMGFIENVHYVVGKKPPRSWTKPLKEPGDYTHFITFYWGSTIECLSMERPDNIRGGSYDYFEIDEAGLLPEYTYTDILLPALRGNRDIFGNCPFHQQISFYTSIPWKSIGYWIFAYEEKAKLEPEKYFWMESTAYDNLHIIGLDGIERLREEMGFLKFQVEVMNHRVNKATNPYFSKFDEEKHTYTPKFEYRKVDDVVIPKAQDVNTERYLEASFDFGKFNCCTVWQQDGRIERCVNEFYVSGGNTLKDLVTLFCKEYKEHKFKYIKLWGEPRGHDLQPGTKTWYELLTDYFTEEGWRVEVCAPRGYRTDKHETRQESMNEIFEAKRSDLPTVLFNDTECKNTIIVMRTTELDYKGKKDKTNEKNSSFPQHLATHFGDTVEYYLFYKYLVKRRMKGRKREVMGMAA